MKKKFGMVLVTVISLLVLSLPVFADFYMSWWPSTLSLGIGKSLTGSTREYLAGKNGIRIAVSKLVTDSTHKELRLETQYIEEASNYCELIGQVTFKTQNQTGFSKEWGILPDGNRYYTFSTKIDGKSYAGIISNEVIMYSEHVS